jgi:transposase-like protein
MPQVQLPVFPAGVTFINDALACQEQDGQVVYLNGHLPVFTHAKDDLASFRFFTTQLIVNGSATQGEISRAFGVPIITVKRGVKRHRQRGAAAFFTPAPRREGTRLTAEVRQVAQVLLAQGQTVPEVSRQTGVLASTIHKAIGAGRLPRPTKKKFPPPLPPPR